MPRGRKRGQNLTAHREAEKDLVFALYKLQSGDRASAFMNAAAAVSRLAETLNKAEWDAVRSESVNVLVEAVTRESDGS